MTDDYDKKQWQADQAARDSALEKQREKERKARERSARNAKRKLERLHRTLKESGDITDWEDEFSVSVSERLDTFGSAFSDLQKGRPGDALSFSQKRVVAALNKKVKDAKKAARSVEDEDGVEEPTRSSFKPRSSFQSKGKPKFTPRVRHIEDDFIETPPPRPKPAPFIPKFVKDPVKPSQALPVPSNRPSKPKPVSSPKLIPKPKTKPNSGSLQSSQEEKGTAPLSTTVRSSFLRLVKDSPPET